LTGAHLVAEQASCRYTMHDLLRVYAVELAERVDPDSERSAALTRLLDHYTHVACAANRALAPYREPIPVPLAPSTAGATSAHFADPQQALAWFAVEFPALDAALRQADDAGLDAYTWQLAWSLNTYLNRRGLWHEQVAIWQTAMAAGERLGDPSVRAYSRRALANAFTLLNDHDEAHRHLAEALSLDIAGGDRLGQAYTHYNLSIVYERQGDQRHALEHAERALDLYRASESRRGEATMLNAVGWYYSLLGDHDQALAHCSKALPMLQDLGDRLAEANTWDSLGHAHHHLGHLACAADCYRQAITMFRELGDRYNEAITLSNLADTHRATGNSQAAASALLDALAILTDLDHPDAGPIEAKLRELDRHARH
jgi:tetratricopeptide (TPR) repeat protein